MQTWYLTYPSHNYKMQKDSAVTLSFLTNGMMRYPVANDNITTVFRSYKYRLCLKKGQYKELSEIAESQRQLYNAALLERIDCYKKTGVGKTYFDQSRAVTELRKHPEFSNIPTNIQRWTLKRLDNAYKGFFRRGGFPRYRGFHRWKAFGFSEFSGIRFDGKRLRFKGINGSLKVHMHRPLQGDIKSCVFRRDLKGWYVYFQCGVALEKNIHAEKSIGIDVGLETFATLSNGEKVLNPRIAKKAQKELRRKQRALSRCKKDSKRCQKVKVSLVRTHEKIANTRKTFLHQQSARIAREYSLIVVEDLQIKNMVRGNLARSIHDAGWGQFINLLTYKAESAGGVVVKVNPRNTSLDCSECGEEVRKKLSERTHQCPHCGLVMDRDKNAAVNILSRGGIVPRTANVGDYVERLSRNISVS